MFINFESKYSKKTLIFDSSTYWRIRIHRIWYSITCISTPDCLWLFEVRNQADCFLQLKLFQVQQHCRVISVHLVIQQWVYRKHPNAIEDCNAGDKQTICHCRTVGGLHTYLYHSQHNIPRWLSLPKLRVDQGKDKKNMDPIYPLLENNDSVKWRERQVLSYVTCMTSGFSRYAQTKTKYRARSDATTDIRSPIKPNFSELLRPENKYIALTKTLVVNFIVHNFVYSTKP